MTECLIPSEIEVRRQIEECRAKLRILTRQLRVSQKHQDLLDGKRPAQERITSAAANGVVCLEEEE